MTDQTFFNEFVIKCPKPAADINKALLEKKIIGGYEIGKTYEGMEDLLMFVENGFEARKGRDRVYGVRGIMGYS